MSITHRVSLGKAAGIALTLTVTALAAACAHPPAAQARAHPSAILLTSAAVPQTAAPPTTAQMDAEFSAIKADVAASTRLPDGKVLWVYGDTLAAGPRVFCTPQNCPYGYPHNGFALQPSPDSLTLAPVFKSSLPYGFQEIPNGSHGVMYWPTGVVAARTHVYVFCARVKTTGTGGQGGGNIFAFDVIGSAVAVFSPALSLERVVTLPLVRGHPLYASEPRSGYIPSPALWSSGVHVRGGWWLAGTDTSIIPNEGDMAFVPDGDLASPSRWQVHADAFWQLCGFSVPMTTRCLSYVGTSIAIVRTSAGWVAWSKRGDVIGDSIEELTAASPLGPWKVAEQIRLPYRAGLLTYGVALHPELPHPDGKILLSYSVNGNKIFAAYHPLFLYVALG